MSRWFFITNHGAVLLAIARHNRVKAIDIASETGLTERTVRRIIAELIDEGYITREREGGINRYGLNASLPLRRPEMRDRQIRDLVNLWGSGTEKRRTRRKP